MFVVEQHIHIYLTNTCTSDSVCNICTVHQLRYGKLSQWRVIPHFQLGLCKWHEWPWSQQVGVIILSHLLNGTLPGKSRLNYSNMACTRNTLKRFVKILSLNLQLANWDAQIGLVEAVCNVPAEWTELDSLLDESVKEAKTEQQFLKLLQNAPDTVYVKYCAEGNVNICHGGSV